MPKIATTKDVLRNYKNWREIIWCLATHRGVKRTILRNGIRFDSRFVWWLDVYSIFSKSIYTPPPLTIEENDVVVDVGANIGVFSIYAATRTRNIVHAFEPFPLTFDALQHNITMNNMQHIVTHQVAVSDSTGIEHFSNVQDGGMNGLHKLTVRTPDTIEVPSITLSDFMHEQGLDHIDFLKLDCEGAEGVIVPSLPQSCLARICKIAMEFHDGMSPINHQQLENVLQVAGFTTCLVWDGISALGYLYAWR